MRKCTDYLLVTVLLYGMIWGQLINGGIAWADEGNASSLVSFSQANIDWHTCENQTINVLLSGHPIQATILELLQEFKELTGIKVAVKILPEEEFFSKLNIDFEKSRGAVDVFMTSPLYHWHYAKKGWIEGLNKYIDNKRLTDKTWYDPDDFFPTLWKSSMWNGNVGSGMGEGDIYSIPIWWEGCTLMYRKDLAPKFDFTAPENWNDMYRQIVKIPKLSKGKMLGIVCRGIRSWSQIHTYHLTMMASQGGQDINPHTGKAVFNSPIGVEVANYWLKMIRKAGSPNWFKYNWYEVSSEFQAGKSFAAIDANPFAVILEAEGSPIRGKVGYLLPPAGVKGRRSSLWMWSLGINAYSKHKDASWLFIQWVTSKAILRKAVDLNNWMAPRKSVWFDPEVKDFLGKIDNGRWYRNSTKLVTELVKMCWSPNPLASTLGNLWGGAVQDAWMSNGSVAEKLDKAASEFNTMMKE